MEQKNAKVIGGLLT